MEDTNASNENGESTPETESVQITNRVISGLIFEELCKHARFRMFVESNYEIKVFKNDEEKRIECIVEEVPSGDVMAVLNKQIRGTRKDKSKRIVLASERDLKKLS